MCEKQLVISSLLLPILLSLCCACSPRTIRDARAIVVHADSLREVHLVAQNEYDDSLLLAQAYHVLDRWQWFYADDYAHACYHYGRLLRSKDDHVGAMKVFINATRSRTRDHHILGRVYSNMAELAHLVGNFPLAYDMFEISTNHFLQKGDSLLYYYGLNNMAGELAEQGKKEEAYTLLHIIENNTVDNNVLIKSIETKARACDQVQQYDSVVYYTNDLLSHGYLDIYGISMAAQAQQNLGNLDSALHKTRIILEQTNDNRYLISALYILSRTDSTLTSDSILTITSARADAQRAWGYSHGDLSRAIQLLEQELERQPDFGWLYIAISFVLTSGVLGYLLYRRRKHHLLLTDLEEKEQMQERLTQTIDDLSIRREEQRVQMRCDVEKVCSLIHESDAILTLFQWHNYTQMCNIANQRLYGIVDHLIPFGLSEKEIRLCILIVLNADTKQMVELIPYSHSGLGKFKYTTAKKLGTQTSNMRVFLLNLLS